MAEPPTDPLPAEATTSSDTGTVGTVGPYQSLYRRFRPQRFSEVKGQDHVTRALRNAVREGRVAHAYLFSGPRGTGKTSTARILAMALNCEQPQDGEPDGSCPSCVDIRRGASVDVQELDAASNRRIDEMRDLLSRVALGTRGRWKVYIIDEVHQLTGDAASALLKTLEEPPPHVVFVLATTDPQKVLPTIRSRTIHFEFRLLVSDTLGGLVRDVNDKAGLGLSAEAIDQVVRRGNGSARDALTVLDQVAAAGGVEDEADVVAEIIDGLIERDAKRVLGAVAEAMVSGRDARRLGTELVETLRNGFLATMAPGLVMLPEDAAARVAEQASRLGPATLVRAMEGIGQALVDMRESVDARVSLEVALVRLAHPELDATPAALVERIERLEQALARGGGRTPPDQPSPPSVGPAPGSGRPSLRRPSSGGSVPPGPPVPPRESAPPREPHGVETAPAPSAAPALPSRDELTKAWGDGVLKGLSGRAKAYLGSGRFVSVDPDGAVYALPDKHLVARSQDVKAEAETALAARFQQTVPLKLVVDPGARAIDRTPPPSDSDATVEEDMVDFVDLEEAPSAVTSPEQRLLEAFPGAEEVSP